jgi:hypothetical protein
MALVWAECQKRRVVERKWRVASDEKEIEIRDFWLTITGPLPQVFS